MSLMSMNGTRLHVEDHGGNGRPVVLIHGWPMSAESWAPVVPALKDAGFRVIAYDRRGFGRSDKPASGYDYDTLAADLAGIMDALDLRDASLVGFSMGGGEVARYPSRYGTERLRSVVFAAAVPPCLMKSEDNPDGPLTEEAARSMEEGLREDREEFFDQFTQGFYSVAGDLKVSEDVRQKAIAMCLQSDQGAALGCMEAFGTTDFREDLPKIDVPALILHGDSDEIVPIEGSGARTAKAVKRSETVVIKGAPHGVVDSHTAEFNAALVAFLRK